MSNSSYDDCREAIVNVDHLSLGIRVATCCAVSVVERLIEKVNKPLIFETRFNWVGHFSKSHIAPQLYLFHDFNIHDTNMDVMIVFDLKDKILVNFKVDDTGNVFKFIFTEDASDEELFTKFKAGYMACISMIKESLMV